MRQRTASETQEEREAHLQAKHQRTASEWGSDSSINCYLCSGIGFVHFKSPMDALHAVQSLNLHVCGVKAEFTKVPQLLYYSI